MHTINMMSTIGQAFIIGAMKHLEHPQSEVIASLVDKGKHVRKVKEWDAHLSKRTYDKLKAEGVMP